LRMGSTPFLSGPLSSSVKRMVVLRSVSAIFLAA
jgi:hypothetical protein